MRYMVQIINCTDFFWRDNYLACFKHNKKRKRIFSIPLRECSYQYKSIVPDCNILTKKCVPRGISFIGDLTFCSVLIDFEFPGNIIYTYAYAHMFIQVRYADIRHHPRFPRFPFIPGSSSANLLELNVCCNCGSNVFFCGGREGRRTNDDKSQWSNSSIFLRNVACTRILASLWSLDFLK